MKKLLLIGDSIRMNYQPEVIRRLNGKVSVFAPQDNARFAKYTLWYAREWLYAYGTPDIIHWNNGIWDVYRHEGENEPFTPMEQYLDEIEKIFSLLKNSGAKIIFASTTPAAFQNIHVQNDDVDRYNSGAIALLEGKGVFISDLNTPLRRDLNRYISDDLLHLSQEGISLCAEIVAKAVQTFL